MICPNCGASNGSNAVYCNRCRQRLPLAGPNSGISYPYRRSVASRVGGNNRGTPVRRAVPRLCRAVQASSSPSPSHRRGARYPAPTSPRAPRRPLNRRCRPSPRRARRRTPTPLPTLIIDLSTPTPGATSELTPSPTAPNQPDPHPGVDSQADQADPKPTRKPTPTPTPLPLSCADAQGTHSVVDRLRQPDASGRAAAGA